MTYEFNTSILLSQINTYDKYARYLEQHHRRETHDEIVSRVENMHLKKFPNLRAEISEAFQFVRDKKLYPSMRSMQFAGKALELNNSRMYNCSATTIQDPKDFAQIMFLLLSGAGVGFSVQKHHVAKLPKIKHAPKKQRYLIADSIEGWSDAVKALCKSHFGKLEIKPIFDYSEIRPKGSPLKTGGGKAPGSEPLKTCLSKIDSILSSYPNGYKLKPIDVHDIVCHISNCVVSGGIRRAALISLFSNDDLEMLEAKKGNWWDKNPQRAMANNSIVLDRETTTKEEFLKIWKMVEDSGAGEPGIIFTNDYEMLMNPCAEVSLQDHGFCNLVEINASNIEDQKDLEERCKWASFIATLQASYTDFHYLDPKWKEIAEEDSLIGIGLTGICDGKVLSLNLKKAANKVISINQHYSSIIGINPSKRTTVVKPSGNSATCLMTSSGVHARYAPYYWRRMRISKNTPLANYLEMVSPFLLETEEMNPTNYCVKVAIRSPEKAIFRDEPVFDFLERVKFLHENWIKPGHMSGNNENNVSATVSIKNDEWKAVGEWMWKNKNHYNGISVLPYDGGTYSQTPYEDCTKEDYEDFVKKCIENHLHNPELFNLANVLEYEDGTNHQGEAACASGACEVI